MLKKMVYPVILQVVFSVLLSAASLQSWAEASLRVTAVPQSVGSASLREALHSQFEVYDLDFVFNANEREFLIQQGQLQLAGSLQFSVPDESSLERVRARMVQRGILVTLEKNSLPLALTELPHLETLQWGIKNVGKSQIIPLQGYKSAEAPALAGEDVKLFEAPPESVESAHKIKVAILDSGIDLNHPSLRSQIYRNESECHAYEQYRACIPKEGQVACTKKWAAVDSNANGYPLDCNGWNVTVGKNPQTGIIGNSNPQDEIGHGTHVAGIIGAQAGLGSVRGMIQNVTLIPIKVINDTINTPKAPVKPQAEDWLEPPTPTENDKKWTTGFADVIARGLLYAIRSGAQVVNLSLSWPRAADTELIRSMIRLAQKQGMIVVAAAGNDSTESEVMPCSYSGVVCVGSFHPDGKLSKFSNHGPSVDITAPGLNILSTYPLKIRAVRYNDLNGFEFKNGTSMSTPFVTGALARLLNAGFSPEESVARLYLGARTPRDQTDRESGERIRRFGNLDLAQSFRIKPQPLILPSTKAPTKVSWDGVSETIPFAVELKNFWTIAAQAQVTWELVDSSGRVELSSASDSSGEIWESGQLRSYPMELKILDRNFPSQLLLRGKVRFQKDEVSSDFQFFVRLIVSVRVTPTLAQQKMLGIENIAIEGKRLSEKVTIQSINSVNSSVQDYLAIEPPTGGAKEYQLHLIAQKEDSKYQYQATLKVAPDWGNLLNYYRMDWNLDGIDEYVVLLNSKNPTTRKNLFRFLYLDRNLSIIRTVEYEALACIIPETFSWLSLGSELTPAWVWSGFTPELEKPKYDPWNPSPRDNPQSRFYYLAQDGLRSVAAPKDMVFISLLVASPQQKSRGELQVLLAKGGGTSYRLNYFIGTIRLGKTAPELVDVTELEMLKYRMLFGIDNQVPILSLNQKFVAQAGDSPAVHSESVPSKVGLAFGSAGASGSLRNTLIWSVKSQGFSRVADWTQRSLTSTDTVLRLAGVFSGPERAGLFTQTQYDLLYQDWASGKTISTSLHRFTFIPQLSFLRSFIPVVGEDVSTQMPLPAMLVDGGVRGDEGSDIVFPRYSSQGELMSFEQPARLRLLNGAGCTRVDNPIEANSKSPAKIVFYCGDRFLYISVNY